jgi:hypothetical protein
MTTASGGSWSTSARRSAIRAYGIEVMRTSAPSTTSFAHTAFASVDRARSGALLASDASGKLRFTSRAEPAYPIVSTTRLSGGTTPYEGDLPDSVRNATAMLRHGLG